MEAPRIQINKRLRWEPKETNGNRNRTEEEKRQFWKKSGRKNYEDITTGIRVTLKKGDLLVFSANIIHRGIYGNNRLALDILFCESSPELIQYVDSDCLPDNELIKNIKRSNVFKNTIKVKSQSIKIDT